MITLRSPSTIPTASASATATIAAPPLSFLSGTWSVTHSTLPMWKKSRNVRIMYTPITGTGTPGHIDDLVTYQNLSSTKIKSVQGVDKPNLIAPAKTGEGEASADAAAQGGGESNEKASLAYNWRGKGWLMIASSKWEILGYGDEEGTGNKWVVTYFAKTLFTPAGVDFYSRKGSLKPETVEEIKRALARLDGDVKTLAETVFEVKMDGDRTD